jgi:hypothetical protein
MFTSMAARPHPLPCSTGYSRRSACKVNWLSLQLDCAAIIKVFLKMDFSSKINIVIGISLLALVLNLFFGYFRGKQKKFSFKWFLYIHLPIPLVVLARLYSHLDYRYIPIFLFVSVVGQVIGARLEI